MERHIYRDIERHMYKRHMYRDIESDLQSAMTAMVSRGTPALRQKMPHLVGKSENQTENE